MDNMDPIYKEFDDALAKALGPRQGRLRQLMDVPVISNFVGSAYVLWHARHRFFALRCMAQVGFANSELARHLLGFPVLGGLLLFFVWHGRLPAMAVGSAGPVMAGLVIFFGIGLILMVLAAAIDFCAVALGTVAHARGQVILEKTNLSEIDGMGRNVFSPRQ